MRRWFSPFPLLALALLAGAAAFACDDKGEDRPDIDVIGGGGSVSVSGVGPGGSTTGSELYTPSTNQDLNLAIALDLRDIREVMAPAARDESVDWAKATAIYTGGANQERPDGSLRTLASLATDGFDAAFPNGAAVYGRSGFIDALIRDGLAGTGRAAGLSDNVRREVVDRGLQMLLYGRALALIDIAQARAGSGAADSTIALDEAWATLAGAADENGNRNNGLLATAVSREEDFNLQGKIARPLEARLYAAVTALERRDTARVTTELTSAKASLNTIFYLSVVRDLRLAAADQRASDRTLHLVDGWAYFQSLRAPVAAASASSAATLEALFNRSGEDELPSDIAAGALAALNDPAVLTALAIPAEFQVK